jgi:hypothetical protein
MVTRQRITTFINLMLELLWYSNGIIRMKFYKKMRKGIFLRSHSLSSTVILKWCAAAHRGASRGVPRILLKLIFKRRDNPICIQIYYIHEILFLFILKYINIFLILYMKCVRKFVYVLQCAVNQKSLRTTGVVIQRCTQGGTDEGLTGA